MRELRDVGARRERFIAGAAQDDATQRIIGRQFVHRARNCGVDGSCPIAPGGYSFTFSCVTAPGFHGIVAA